MAPREEFTLLEDRLVSGLGLLQLPQDVEYRAFRIWFDLVRLPAVDFFNGKWNPERSEYAKITWVTGDYVVREQVISYKAQVFDYFPKEPAAFLAPYIVCSQQSQSNALVAIALAVGIPGATPGDPLFVEPVKLSVDAIRIACREESAFQIRLYGLKEDVGCDGATPNPKVNSLPPSPLPLITDGSAIEVSAPYLFPTDDGNTIPFDGDVLPPNPADDCNPIQFTISWKSTFNPNTFSSPLIVGQSPVRVVVTDTPNGGNIIYQNSDCVGGVVTDLYGLDSAPISAISLGQPNPEGTYETVTVDNPAIPIVFV